IDDLLREYLLFRGFKDTLSTFERDIKQDHDKGFDANKIVNELLALASELKIEELLEYWRYLSYRFFSHLSPKYHRTTKMFEKRLLRLYLVSAVNQGKREDIRAFMDKHGRSLGQQGGDWIPWLGIEYLEEPKNRAEFEAYFSDEWYLSLRSALTDFIQTVFPALAIPRILLFDKEHRECEALRRKVKLYEEHLLGETRITTAPATSGPVDFVEDHIGGVAAAASPRMRPTDANPVTGALEAAVSSETQLLDMIPTDEVPSLLKISQEEIFLEHNAGIGLAKFSPSGELIASYDDESILKVWSPDPSSAAPKVKNELDFTVNAMAWDRRHDHLLYLHDEDGFIHTLNTNTNLMSRQLVSEKRYPWMQCMIASRASSTLLTVCSTKPENTSDVSVRIWDAGANKTVASRRFSAAAEAKGVCAALNHNGNIAALAYSTGYVRLADLRTLETVGTIRTKQRDVCSAEFSLDEDSLMVVTEVGGLTQWSLRKGSQMTAESTL
ncbi:WD40 repeat-like protein, partial [Coemansia reversa NRRL 1564]